MKVVKRFFAVTLVFSLCIIASFTSNSAETSTLNGVKSAIEGVISYKSNSFKVNSYSDLLDSLSDNAGTTASDWYYISLSQYGINCKNSRSISTLKSAVNSFYNQNLENVRATDMQRVSLALISCGENITDVNGNNLLADCTYNRGSFKPLEEQGINALAFALILLDSKDFNVSHNLSDSKNDIINKILGLELSAGGFAITGTSADADTTAMVLQSLAPHKSNGRVKSVINSCVQLLSDRQSDSGAFKSYGKENAESTAQVIIALTSLGINPFTDSRFIKNGNNAVDGLMNFQISNGGFCHLAGYSADNMATCQSLCALVSCYRFLNNQGRFYDFSSAKSNNRSHSTNNNYDSSRKTHKSKNTSNSPFVSKGIKSSSSKSADNTSVLQNPAEKKNTKDIKNTNKNNVLSASDTAKQSTADEAIKNRINKKSDSAFATDYNNAPKNLFFYLLGVFLLLTAGYVMLYIIKSRRYKR